MATHRDEHTARIVGRSLRLLLGAALIWMTYDVMRSENAAFNLRALVVVPVVLVFVLGGPLGRVGSVAYVGISLLLQGLRNDGGCEVMSIPAILFGKRTHLACIAFSPIDWVEKRLATAGDTEST